MRCLDRCVKIACVVLLAAVVGCGGTYAKRLQNRVDQAKKGQIAGKPNPRTGKVPTRGGSPTLALLFNAVLAVPDAKNQPTGINIQLPKPFYSDQGQPLYSALVPAEPANNPANVKVVPPGIDAKDLIVTYELYWKDSIGKELPAYMYFAAVPHAAGATPAAIEAKIAGAWNLGTEPMWTDIAGNGISWRKMTASGNVNYVDRQNATHNVPGRFDAYVATMPNRFVIIGFNAPQAVQSTFDFFGAGEAAVVAAKVEDTGGAPVAPMPPAPR